MLDININSTPHSPSALIQLKYSSHFDAQHLFRYLKLSSVSKVFVISWFHYFDTFIPNSQSKENILIFDFVKKFYCSQFNQSNFWPHMSKQ